MTENQLRYIVLTLDTNSEQFMSNGDKVELHDGAIYKSIQMARQNAREAVNSGDFNRFIIGSFILHPQHEVLQVHCVETHGFKNDRKNINQLSLFK